MLSIPSASLFLISPMTARISSFRKSGPIYHLHSVVLLLCNHGCYPLPYNIVSLYRPTPSIVFGSVFELSKRRWGGRNFSLGGGVESRGGGVEFFFDTGLKKTWGSNFIIIYRRK